MSPVARLNRLALVACLALAGRAGAHGDADVPLYVAAEGRDEGRCTEPAAPCRTLGYALGQAGKGTQIRVAAGRFPVEDTEDLFLVVSGVVDVVGGFDPAAGFATRAEGAMSTLTGVPEDYRAALRERGFHVIADTKGAAVAAETGRLLAVHEKLQAGAAAAPCVNGSAGSLACEKVDLLAHLPLDALSARPSRGNDVWGFTDLNSGREYAIAGTSLGTAVVDVTDPENPREVGFVDGQNASWRDIKVFQHYDAADGRFRAYAYVTTDGSSDGLFVIDLGGLPHTVARRAYPSQFAAAHNLYGTSTDFMTGLPLTDSPHLVIAGSNLGAGQYRAYSLATPASPAFVAGSDVGTSLGSGDPSYMHDAASLVIGDARAASCPNAVGTCELLLDFNEEKLEIWDITDIADPRHLTAGSPEYAQRGYVHSGWWSEDRRYVFVHDELDEQRFNINTTLRVFSIDDITNPQLVGQWTGPTNAIDHNGFVRGNRYYMSNYSRGLAVLDITDPANPGRVGFLDTYPFSDGEGYVGAWGAFPYFASGTVAISDISSGLYLARESTRDVPAGRLTFTAASFGAEEGLASAIGVERLGGSAGAVAVTIEAVHATASGDDYTLATTTLNWADGDAAAQTVDLAGAADGAGEGLEMLLLRLVDPRGGATLDDRNVAAVYLADPGASPRLEFFEPDIEVTERGFGHAVVVVRRTGSGSGSVSVDYALAGGDAAAGDDFEGSTTGTLTWADGDARPQSLEFAIADDGAPETDEFFEIALTNASGASIAGAPAARVTIKDGAGANLAPNAVAGSGLTAAENSAVTLDGSGSNDPDGDSLSYAWTQASGPPVTLSAPAAAVTGFTAPSVSSDALLRFELTVSDPGGLSDTAKVSVTVTNSDASGGGGEGGGAAWWLVWLLLLARHCEAAGRSYVPFFARLLRRCTPRNDCPAVNRTDSA